MTVTLQELAAASRVMRDALKDRSYRVTPLGLEVARYIRWMRNERGATEETLRDYERTLAWLSVDHADLDLASFEAPVGTERLREFLDHRWGDTAPRTTRAAAGQRSNRTRAKNVSILRSFFAWAVREAKMHSNPALAIGRPQKRDVEQPIFSGNVVERIVLGEPRLRDRVALRMLATLALRKGGLRAFQLRHYDQPRQRVRIFTKGGKIRELPVSDPWLRAELEEYITERLAAGGTLDEYLLYPEKRGPRHQADRPEIEVLWRDPLRPMATTTMHRWWSKKLERAGVPHARMHQMRHTSITDFIRASHGRIDLAQQLAMHAQISTTMDVYGHVPIEDLAEALRLIAEKREERD